MRFQHGRFARWLKHLMLSQLLALIFGIIVILSFPYQVYTDSPVLLRREAQWKGSFFINTFTPLQSHGVLLKVAAKSQLPDLFNGCEVTSLSMLLDYLHVYESPIALASMIKRDPTPLVTDNAGDIISWGNPNRGFVGSITGKSPGFGVFHGPITQLLNRFIAHRGLDLTGSSFNTLLSTVRQGRPIIVWTTINFTAQVPFVHWSSPTGLVKTTLFEHAVLLVGFDKKYVYVNNPLNGQQAEPIPIASFRASWIALGKQAVTVAPYTRTLTIS